MHACKCWTLHKEPHLTLVSHRAACCNVGPDGKAVQAQVVPVSNSTRKLQRLMQAEGVVADLDAAAAHELVFLAHLPPLG